MPDQARDETLQDLGHAIRLRRAALRLTQKRAAAQIGLHANYLGALERGETNPTYLTLTKVASGLEMSVEVLIVQAASISDAR